MKDWVVLTVAVSVVSSLYSLLLADGRGKKAFRTLCSVALITVLLFPAFKLSGELTDFDFDDYYDEFSFSFSDKSDEVVSSAAKNGYESLLREKLLNKHSEIKNIKAEISFEDDILELKSVEIILSETIENYDLIEEEIWDITDSECEVIFINEF